MNLFRCTLLYLSVTKKNTLQNALILLLSSAGKFVDRFEELVACDNGLKGCSDTWNLSVLSVLMNEPLTQALTFIATIDDIGAHPVFLDVDRDTLGFSPLVKRWLSTHAEVRS
ncbi:hypothetical protein [Bacteroides hominis]|uniref:hypothetical protein n=1 Tax=Bacteroides hominis TaxID=2763023 RepID=UPI003D6C9FDA